MAGLYHLPRVADQELAARLSSAGAVLIEGPKACGKTETAKSVSRNVVRMDIDAGARALVYRPLQKFSSPIRPRFCSMNGKQQQHCGT